MQVLLILHLLGFGAGITASFMGPIMMSMMRAAPGDAPVLSKVPPRVARVGQVGLGTLWITGIIMFFMWPGQMPPLFWWKLACVVLITISVGLLGVTVRQVQGGDMSVASRLPILGAISGVLMLLIVILAVYAFD